MEAVSSATNQTTELFQKLSLDSQTKPQDAKVVTDKIPVNEKSVTPFLHEVDPNTGYLFNGYQAFYYEGYNGCTNGWDEHMRLPNHGGVDMSHGIYGDVYHYGYGYAPYAPYCSPASPVPSLGQESQVYGTQQYQYSGSFYQPPTSQAEISASVNQPLISVDATKVNTNSTANGNANQSSVSASLSGSHKSSSPASNYSYGNSVFTGGHFDAIGSLYTCWDGSGHTSTTNSTSRNQTNHPSNFMGFYTPVPTPGCGSTNPAFISKMYPNNHRNSHYKSKLRTGYNFGLTRFNSSTNGQWGVMVDSTYKPAVQGKGLYGYGNENAYGFYELNRGPRDGRYINLKDGGPVTSSGKDQNLASFGTKEYSAVVPDKEQYNQTEFSVEYADAKFFIIKSYNEDDVHKSIKYGVWASTPNGNKKLDAAFKESQGKTGGCPVFLFFSVNASGQFVGLAEMVGPVDFNKTVDYWHQDKWTGCFSLKWCIVKDVPNSILRHISVESNDNKPVTNSRDTQEINLEQGLQMVKIFKEHTSKTSILDDFLFYENRQKIMLERKEKQHQISERVDQKPVESDEKDDLYVKPSESVPCLNTESSLADPGEQKPVLVNGMAKEVASVDVKPENGK